MSTSTTRRDRNSALAGLSAVTYDPTGRPQTQPGETNLATSASQSGLASQAGHTGKTTPAGQGQETTKVTIKMPLELAARARGAYLREGAIVGQSFSAWLCQGITRQVEVAEKHAEATGPHRAEAGTLPRGRLPQTTTQ